MSRNAMGKQAAGAQDTVGFPANLERDYPVLASNLKTANLFLLNQVGDAMTLILGRSLCPQCCQPPRLMAVCACLYLQP